MFVPMALGRNRSGICKVDEVIAVGGKAKRVGCGLVERALPEHGELWEGIFDVGRGNVAGIVVEDGHLLAFVRPDAGVTVAGNEHAIVADHNGENAVLKVVGEQADVTQSMVFAASRASEDHEVAPAVFAEPAHGFCQVVGLLFADADKDVSVTFGHVGGDRIAVADDEVGYDTNVVKALDGSVAAYAERGALHPGLKAFPTGKFPGCHYDGIRTVGLQVEDGG